MVKNQLSSKKMFSLLQLKMVSQINLFTKTLPMTLFFTGEGMRKRGNEAEENWNKMKKERKDFNIYKLTKVVVVILPLHFTSLQYNTLENFLNPGKICFTLSFYFT